MADRIVMVGGSELVFRDLLETLPIDHPVRIQRALDDWCARQWWNWREAGR
tara:strand:+ start:691 stop:843 length:153 start_codon:yes stop_codon:yes gene_type:complete